MSQAFKCDICGSCVDDANDAKSEREVARQSVPINGIDVDMYIKVGASVAHVCDSCFSVIMQKVKQWVIANIT